MSLFIADKDWFEQTAIDRRSQESNVIVLETDDKERLEELRQLVRASNIFPTKQYFNIDKGNQKTEITRLELDPWNGLTDLGNGHYEEDKGFVEDKEPRQIEMQGIPTGAGAFGPAMKYVEQVLKRGTTALIISNITQPELAKMISLALQEWAYDLTISNKKSVIFVVTPDANLFDAVMRRRFIIRKVPVSLESERQKIIEKTCKVFSQKGVEFTADSEVLRVTNGLTLHDLETILLKLVFLNDRLGRPPYFKMADVVQLKMQMLEKYGYKLVYPERGFEQVGGYNTIKSYLKENVIDVENDPRARERRVTPARGIILFGLPGTGKTLLSSSMAKELGRPFIEAGPQDLFAQHIGESEEKTLRLLTTVENMEAVLFIDEVDDIGQRREMVMSTDSIPAYSPIVIRREDGLMDIVSLEDLYNEIEQQAHLKSTGTKGEDILEPVRHYEVWSDVHGLGRWTAVKHVLRHKYSGPMVRVNCHEGVVDATPNHCIYISGDGSSKTSHNIRNPETVKVGENLVIPWLVPKTYYCDKFFYGTRDVAWLYGFFVAEGSAYIHNGFLVSFSNNDKKLLAKTQQIMKTYFTDRSLTISQQTKGRYIPTIKYVWHGKRLYQHFLRFYTSSRLKRIPKEILNAPSDIIHAFLDGYLAGDGRRNLSKTQQADTNSLVLAAGIHYIANRLNRGTSIAIRRNKPNITTLTIRQENNPAKSPKRQVKNIVTYEYSGYVYDLETADHTFCTGVGPVLVHNSGVGKHIVGMLLKWMAVEKRRAIVMFATNLLEQCDEAFIRPGRVDLRVPMFPPDFKARVEILKIHSQMKRDILPKTNGAEIINEVAKRTTGWVGSELENLVQSAARKALKEKKGEFKVELDHFIEAMKDVGVNMEQRETQIKGFIEVAKAHSSSQRLVEDQIKGIISESRGNLLSRDQMAKEELMSARKQAF